MALISAPMIYAMQIKQIVDSAKLTNTLLTIQAQVPNLIGTLPSAAFVSGVLVLDFQNWTLEQLTVEQTTVSGIVVFGEDEYPFSFSTGLIQAITDITIKPVNNTNFTAEQLAHSYAAFTMLSGEVIKHKL